MRAFRGLFGRGHEVPRESAMNRSIPLSLAVTMALGLAACGPKDEPKKSSTSTTTTTTAAPAAPAGVTITIAHAGPLTGSIAHLGKDDENGVALAIDQANAKKITIDGKPVTFKMVSEDDQADPKVGTTVAQKLVDQKVVAVVGHLNSGVTIPASEIYAKAGIPVISGSATNPQLTERNLKTVFRTVGRDDQQGPAIASYISGELKAKKVAIADDKTSYGEGLANEVEKSLKGAKVAIVGRERTTDKETDFKAILTKIKAKNPDVVFYGGMDATGGPLIKQARELGIKAVFAFGDGACTDEMGKLAGQAAEGLVCSQAGLPREAASKEFADAFKAKYGEIKQYAPYFYDGTMAIIEAMKKANSTDPAKFAPEMFNVSFTGATGTVAFDAKGDRKDAEMTIFKLQGGKVVPISIVKNGTATAFKADAAGAAAPAAGSAPAAAPADAKAAPADAKKDEPKKEEPKKDEKKK
jgi:branched-chain amino acid transport system substrate-binding protein